MPALLDRPRLGAVIQTSPGVQIAQRRTRLGMTLSALAREAGVDRNILSKIEQGGGAHRDSTIGTLNATLDRLEAEMGMDVPAVSSVPTEEGMVEFLVAGNFGVSVTMKGPVRNIAELEEAVARLVGRLQAERDS